MQRRHGLSCALALALVALGCGASPPPPPDNPPPVKPAPVAVSKTNGRFTVPVSYHKLDNGLKVVLSRDTTAPIVALGVYYNIGFRIEPKDRTGFAHLFEHMMFQGSQNLGKMEFIHLVQNNGGVVNGSTRFDFTNYMEIFPAHSLRPILWAEADRMRGLAITQENLTNQQGVVKNEVKGNVLNRPYGGFPWLDMPQYANSNWYNAHNFYGELTDLDAATLDDVKKFFTTYYAPNNAVVAMTGDFDEAQALAWIREYFGKIPAAPQPKLPDIAEPRQEQEKRATKPDPLAPRPALAVGYHAPPRNTPAYYAMGLLDQILLQGDDSRLHQALVQKRGLTDSVWGGINVGLGNMFNVSGPTLWVASLIHDPDKPSSAILEAMDPEIEKLRAAPVDKATLDLALVKMRSALYDQIEGFYGFGRVDLLASFALFDDDPERINRLEDEFRKVTPEILHETAKEWLRPTNRTVLVVEPKPAAAEPAKDDKKPAAKDDKKKPAAPKPSAGGKK
ncbi:M16 family metallopeptidase [Polyangium aurulentum]|uniref:M16 family metallopeptidase n=1 Tax=Polyangium aurulentum TaxID=2567896 RepID=UPI0010AE7AE5|nr:pitrilysin family protein [Polyangium aurulentum]UQA57654.1 insulinase family protein [Polyangium aurulentum]